MTGASLEPEGVEAYFAAASACADPGRMAELAEGATRDLAPHQLAEFYRRMQSLEATEASALFHATARTKWLLRLKPPVFDNTRLASHARLFAAQGVTRSRKVLLVVFTGQGGGLFVSAARLLSRLPEGRFDVLWLRTEDGCDYPHGVPGFADGFAAVCRRIADMAPDYAGAASLGGSLGGYSALRAAILVGMGAGVSLSGRFSNIRWWKDRPDAPSFDPLCGCVRPSAAALTAYFSEDHEGDTRHAARLAAMHPAVRLVPLRTHQHNVLAHILAAGMFDELFDGLYRTCAGENATV